MVTGGTSTGSFPGPSPGGDEANGFFWGLFREILVGEEFVFAVHDDTVAGVPQVPGEPH